MEKFTQVLKDYGLDPIEVYTLPDTRYELSLNMAFSKALTYEETLAKVVNIVKALNFEMKLGGWHLMSGEYSDFQHFIADFDKA